MPDWIDNTIPLSTRFDDTYYSRHNGQQETSHVYINGNDLPARWPKSKNFTIAELGFGTGLNFLETFRQWQQFRPPNGKLSFVSFEQYPLEKNDMEKALSQWRELEILTDKLLEHWDTTDTHFTMAIDESFELNVIFGDANEQLQIQKFQADAWYLDGFTPSKNPELWNELLMRAVFEKTAPNGSFATYSVAGVVRRNLQNAGFEIERAKGFATKREMLKGYKPRV